MAATIPQKRPYALGSHGKGGPPREYLPAVASLSANAGDVLTGAGGYASHASANALTTALPASGILEVGVRGLADAALLQKAFEIGEAETIQSPVVHQRITAKDL